MVAYAGVCAAAAALTLGHLAAALALVLAAVTWALVAVVLYGLLWWWR
jgi:hypothetical protein